MKKTKKQPAFKAKSGQVDYTNIRWAPTINCVLRYKEKILVVQRNKNLKLYPGLWNGISGFLDDQKSLKDKVLEEINEELGLTKKDVISLYFGPVFDQDEPKYKKTWVVHPVLVEIKTDKIKLDWENQKHQWLSPMDAKKLKLLPGFEFVIDVLTHGE